MKNKNKKKGQYQTKKVTKKSHKKNYKIVIKALQIEQNKKINY